MQYHPDRYANFNDPDATAKTQKINEAYEVLSDEKLRFEYDKGGKEGVNYEY
jgi:DnaJ-class molecular chaperone